MTPTLVGMVARLPVEATLAWVRTFKQVMGDQPYRIVLLCDPVEKYKALIEEGVALYPGSLWRAPADPQSICRDRWDEMPRVLAELGATDKVLVTDVRDAIFQRNPFEQMVGPGIFVATEGVTFGEQDWGTALTQQHLSADAPLMLRSKMVCCGVWGASTPALAARFSRDVYQEAKSRPGGVDMHCMNLVLWRQYAEQANVMPYAETAWTAHCSLMYRLNQQPCKTPRFETEPQMRDGKMVNDAGRPFAIVHHVWTDRWHELKALQA